MVVSYLLRSPPAGSLLGLTPPEACNLEARSAARTGIAGIATLQRTTLILAGAAPDAGILVIVQGPLQANVYNLAGRAHGLGFFNLCQSGAGVAYGEEKFRIYG